MTHILGWLVFLGTVTSTVAPQVQSKENEKVNQTATTQSVQKCPCGCGCKAPCNCGCTTPGNACTCHNK